MAEEVGGQINRGKKERERSHVKILVCGHKNSFRNRLQVKDSKLNKILIIDNGNEIIMNQYSSYEYIRLF